MTSPSPEPARPLTKDDVISVVNAYALSRDQQQKTLTDKIAQQERTITELRAQLGAGTPVAPVQPAKNIPLIGVYPGPGRDDDTITQLLGQAPILASSYWQRSNINNMVRSESVRVRKGIHTHIGCGAANDKESFPTGSLDLMKGLADKTTFAVNWWTQYFKYCDEISRVNPSVTTTIFPIVEPEVGVQRGTHHSTSRALGEGTSGLRPKTHATLGRFHNNWYAMAREIAPLCIRGLWIGGWPERNTERNLIFEQISNANAPQYIGFDPYNNADRVNTDTAQQTWAGYSNNWTAESGGHREHYLRWGSPPRGVNETGIDIGVYNDDQMARWVSGFYEGAVALGLTRVILFNSSGPRGDHAFLTPNSPFPKTIVAMSREVTQARTALRARA